MKTQIKDKRVNFDKSLKMHLVCGDHGFTEYIYFKNGFAYATNKKIIVKNDLSICSSIHPDQIKLINGKLLHKNDYKKILNQDVINITEENITCQKGDTKSVFNLVNNSYKIFNNIETFFIEKINASPVSLSDFKLSIHDMSLMNDALYNKGKLNFTFKNPTFPVIICTDEENHCTGIIITSL